MEVGDLVVAIATGTEPVWIFREYPIGQNIEYESVRQSSYCIVLELDEIEGLFTQYVFVLTPRGQGFIRSSNLFDVW